MQTRMLFVCFCLDVLLLLEKDLEDLDMLEEDLDVNRLLPVEILYNSATAET